MAPPPTFLAKVNRMTDMLRAERETLAERGKESAAKAITDYLDSAPATSLARLYDIIASN